MFAREISEGEEHLNYNSAQIETNYNLCLILISQGRVKSS